MNGTAIDTSVLVAAFLTWHAEHDRARRGLEEALAEGTAVVPLHVLLESYAVLTRLPGSLRLSPDDAFSLLDVTFRGQATIANLASEDVFELLDALRQAGVRGGATYDAQIANVAWRAGARRLMTLNTRHFERLSPPGLEVVEP